MQTFGLHRSIYKLKRLIKPEQKQNAYSVEIKRKIEQWEKLKRCGVPDQDISEVIGISRASYYRYKKIIGTIGIMGLERRSRRPKRFRTSKISIEAINIILNIRRNNPTYGKAKIGIILKRDFGITLSESSVGRVLKKLLIQGKITKSASSSRIKRKRRFNNHAQRWQYGMKAKSPGELVQIDHMSVTKHNISMKEFRAWDPITKIIVADVVSNATSSAAAKFLRKVIGEMPFKVTSVQVDGGSEFMKDFEEECKKLNIQLFVLPPNRPQWNGGVERGNRTFREEFYARNDIDAESIGAFKHQLQHAVDKYNTYRPHFSLKGLTPIEYARKILVA